MSCHLTISVMVEALTEVFPQKLLVCHLTISVIAEALTEVLPQQLLTLSLTHFRHNRSFGTHPAEPILITSVVFVVRSNYAQQNCDSKCTPLNNNNASTTSARNSETMSPFKTSTNCSLTKAVPSLSLSLKYFTCLHIVYHV